MRIEVLATDDKEIRRVAWIHRSSGGLQGGTTIGEDIHFTYHESGEFHVKKAGEGLTKNFGPKLSEFSGRFMLSTVVFSKDIRTLPYRKYELKKLDGVVYMDTRVGQRKDIQLGLHLIEINRRDLLIPKLGRITLNADGFTVSAKDEIPTHIHVFTALNPCLLLPLRSPKLYEHMLQAKSYQIVQSQIRWDSSMSSSVREEQKENKEECSWK